MEEVIAWRFVRAREQRPHHHGRRAQRQCFDDMTHIGDAAIGYHRNAETTRVFGNLGKEKSYDVTRIGPRLGSLPEFKKILSYLNMNILI